MYDNTDMLNLVIYHANSEIWISKKYIDGDFEQCICLV